MSKYQKTLHQVLSGVSDSNIDFEELCRLLILLGFEDRTKGSHRIFSRRMIVEIINLQPKGAKAKAYQVKQVRNLILNYKLAEENQDEI